jgi:glycosyltransferase involved in cell wall biosynthesis
MSPAGRPTPTTLPRILLIIDTPGWVFDRHADTLISLLKNDFNFTKITQEQIYLEDDYDLIYPLEFQLIPAEQIKNPAKYVTGIRSHVTWSSWDFIELLNHLSQHFLKVHTVSQRLRDIFSPYLPNVVCLGNGISTEKFIPSDIHRSQINQIKLGWVGNRNQALKGFNQFIRPLENIERVKLAYFGYADRKLEFDEMPLYYADLDVYICSSSFEGSNNPLFEAALMECAIVTTDNGSVPEFLQDGFSALIVERQLESIKKAVEFLRDHPEIRSFLGKNARQAVLHGKWDWKEKAQEYKSFFLEAIENPALFFPKTFNASMLEQADANHLFKTVHDQWQLEAELRKDLSNSVQELKQGPNAYYLDKINQLETYIQELEQARDTVFLDNETLHHENQQLLARLEEMNRTVYFRMVNAIKSRRQSGSKNE